MTHDNTNILLAFIQCRYKALLTRKKEPPQFREFHRLAERQQADYSQKALDSLIANCDPAQILRAPASLSRSIRKHHRYILDATCLLDGHEITLPPIDICDSKDGAARSLMPLSFSNSNKVSESDKLIACVFSLLIADQVPQSVHQGKIIYGDEFKVRHVALRGRNGATRIATEARHVLDAFLKFLGQDAPPPTLQLNRHCDICEFRQRCREEAVQKDDISLLSGLSSSEITQWKAKGILTVNQLACTFQPKRYCRPKYKPKQHSQPLQALAVQERTVFVRKMPTLSNAEVQVFFDVESVPDDNRFYLIGMIREDPGGQSVSQLWASSDEQEMWHAFTKEIDTLPDEFALFHYGSYERTFIQAMLKRHGTCGSQRIGRLSELMCDVHGAIRTNVFFPAYSNRLKDIAASLGFQWTGPITTGIESIVWRKEWESTQDCKLKDALLRYNGEDCEALQNVVQYLQALAVDSGVLSPKVEEATKAALPSSHHFGKSAYVIPEMHQITKRAHFNYQQERIFVRTSRSVRRSLRRKKKKVKIRVNTLVTCGSPHYCPACAHKQLTLISKAEQSKRVTDLRFSRNGVKRWVTEYTTQRWVCRKCGTSFYSPEYPTKGRKCGRGVESWCVHQHVANRQSFETLTDNLNDLFNVGFGSGIAARSIGKLASEYQETEELLLGRLRQNCLMFADETKIKLKSGSGYVWAFSGVEEVLYRFTETRDNTIVQDVIDGFEGVIVSDFYGGYDSAPCQQQKCLVHLIRDINDDMLKAPFNEELKAIASRFTGLLKAIVDDIDKFGLKQRQLNKFVKPASRFQEWVLAQDFRTKPAQRYQKRIRKYGDRLFTFLHHDGVPWNNNVAENAIKLVASRRRFFGASYTREGMRNYLRFLSFYQTLRRKGGSLLRFLLSKEMDLLTFLGE